MILQLLLNGIVAAGSYLLVGLGFSLVYKTCRFFHFAHAIVFTCGAYMTFFLRIQLGVPLGFSIFLSIIFCALLGCLIELIIYRPLKHRRSPPLVLLLASIGVYVVLENIISMVFGNDIKSIHTNAVEEGLVFFGARITPIQILIICVSATLTVGVTTLLKKTRVGRGIRAVASDPELANVSGINSDGLVLWVFAISSALAGVAGILVGIDVNLTPTMGLNVFMMGVAATIIGGSGSIPGTAFGALVLGFAQHLGIWNIGSQWQDAVAFAILLVFLLLRPVGFLGSEVKKATV